MTIQAILGTLDGVDEATKAFYTPQDDKFVLDVAKYTEAQVQASTTGLKSKVDELLGESKAAKEARKAAEDAAQKAADEAARKAGDTEALEASWEKKMNDALLGKETELGDLRSTVESLTVGNQAKDIAAELAVSGSAGVVEQLIKPRLGFEVKDGQARIVVKDASGKPSALTVDELKAEISSDPAFAPLIVASKGSGGGAANPNGGAGTQTGTSGLISAKVPGFSALPKN